MKIERAPKPFRPITITLQTQQDIDDMVEAFREAVLRAESNPQSRRNQERYDYAKETFQRLREVRERDE